MKRSDNGGTVMATAPCVFTGIDVAKAELVVATRPTNESWVVSNDDRGIEALLKRVRRVAPTLVVLEATGGYERAVGSSTRCRPFAAISTSTFAGLSAGSAMSITISIK